MGVGVVMVIRLDIETWVIGKGGTKMEWGRKWGWGKKYGNCWVLYPCECLGVFLLL
jgi:hypothetical protein